MKNTGVSHLVVRWRFLIGGIIVILGAGYGALPAARAWLTAHPPRKPIESTPAELGLSRETLSEWLWSPFDAVQWQVWKLQGVTPAISTRRALQQSSSPIYLISGIQNQGECRVQRYYHEVNPERITLWEVPEAGHVESWTTQREAYETRVLEFFSQIFR